MYRWKRLYNGTLESLENGSCRPKTKHPNSQTDEEIKHIQDLIKRNPTIGLNELYGKLRVNYGYTRNPVTLYRFLRKNNYFKDLKKNFSKRALLSVNCWLLGCIIMTTSSFLISLILKQNVSTNEALVRESIKSAPMYMLFTCSIVAPILEEMVFRKSFYGLIKVKWLFVILSGLLFGLLHVLGSFTSPLDFLYVIPYGAMGSCFAYLLCKTDNITLPIIIHMLHNTVLVMVQIIGR